MIDHGLLTDRVPVRLTGLDSQPSRLNSQPWDSDDGQLIGGNYVLTYGNLLNERAILDVYSVENGSHLESAD